MQRNIPILEKWHIDFYLFGINGEVPIFELSTKIRNIGKLKHSENTIEIDILWEKKVNVAENSRSNQEKWVTLMFEFV